MRYLLLSLFCCTLFFSCQKDTRDLQISGKVKGLKRGHLFLRKWDDSMLVAIDSVKVEGDSEFKLGYSLKEPEVLFLSIQVKGGVFMDDEISFFAEPGEMHVETKLDHFGSAAQITGSLNDSLWRNYLKIKQRYSDKNLELIREKLTTKSKNRDSIVQSIEAKERALQVSRYMATVNFALNHNSHEVAPYVVLDEALHLRTKYLDTVYQALQPQIQDSKYGKMLFNLIQNRKEREKEL